MSFCIRSLLVLLSVLPTVVDFMSTVVGLIVWESCLTHPLIAWRWRMLLAPSGCYNTIFYRSLVEASVSSLPVEISVSSLVLLAAVRAESLMKLLGFFVLFFWFFCFGLQFLFWARVVFVSACLASCFCCFCACNLVLFVMKVSLTKKKKKKEMKSLFIFGLNKSKQNSKHSCFTWSW